MTFWQILQYGLVIPRGVESWQWIFSLGYAAVAVISYLLGSVNTAIVVSKLFYKDDIRNHGSKNAGMTNMFRVYGKKAGFLTLFGDLLKAFLAVAVGYLLIGRHFGGPYMAGFFCVFGHVFPIFYGFRGGKGVIVSAVTILCIDPVVFLLIAIVFGLMFACTRIVSLSSITAAVMYPLISAKFSTENNFIVSVIFSLALGIFVVVMHKDNIKRLLAGEEKRAEFGKKKKKAEPESEKPAKKPGKKSLVDDEDRDDER